MKIVVLDGYTTNPGDLSWDGLKNLGDCDIFDRTSPDKIIERCESAEIILTNKTVMSKEILDKTLNLKYIGLLSTGYNVVDIEAASKIGIVVTNVPSYGTDSVAQTVFSHILNLSHHVSEHAASVSAGDWADIDDFTYQKNQLIELNGKIMGIIGFGRIGQKVAEIAIAFGMKVIFYTSSSPSKISSLGKMCSISEVFTDSDILSLHCPLTEETKYLVNQQNLNLMKKSAFLINTSRGQLIEEKALLIALESGVIAGAGLDVLEIEPPLHDNPLYKVKNCYITPHYSWATKESRSRLIDMVVKNVSSYIEGRVQNQVN